MKRLILFCLIAIAFGSVKAGDLYYVQLSNPSQLKEYVDMAKINVHYFNNRFIVASGELEENSSAVVIDKDAWSDKLDYYIVWLPKDGKRNYISNISNITEIRFQNQDIVVIEASEEKINQLPMAVHGGFVKIQQHNVTLPKQIQLANKSADPFIEGLVAQVNIDSVMADIQHMEDYGTRKYNTSQAVEAQNWIKSQFENFGLSVELTYAGIEGSMNVIATQPGLANPNKYIVVGGHYDSTSYSGDAPGADDNASGTAAVIEIARILSQYEFNYSIIYCAWSAEEIGLYGSAEWTAEAASLGMDIWGYLNLDMISYLQEGSEYHTDVMFPESARPLFEYYETITNLYVDDFAIYEGTLTGGNSDHASFNSNGYMGIFPFEDSDDYSPYIHSEDDIVGLSANNPELAKKFTKSGVAFMAEAAVVFDGLYPPMNLTLTQLEGSVELNWSQPNAGSENFTSYNLYRNEELYQTITSINETSYNDASVSNGETYSYYITANYSGDEGGESSPSNTVSVTIGLMQIEMWDFETSADGWTILDDETGWQWGVSIDMGGNSSNYISIDSDAPGSSTHVADYAISPEINLGSSTVAFVEFDYGYKDLNYDIFELVYRTSPTSDWVVVESIGASTSFTHHEVELPAAALNQQTQIAFHYDDNDSWAWYAAFDNVEIIAAQSENTLTAPTNLSYEIVEENIVLSWNAPESKQFVSYNIYRDGVKIGITDNIESTSFTDDSEFNIGETYVYYVTAEYTEGESNASNQVSVYYEGTEIHENQRATLVLYPNPIHKGDELKIISQQKISNVQVFDMAGKVIESFTNESSVKTVPTQGLNAGIYLVQMNFINGNLSVSKIVITE